MRLVVHPDNPQTHRLAKVIACLDNQDGVIVYPTDTGYAIGCRCGAVTAIRRIAAIKQYTDAHHFTLLFPSLSLLAQYAVVSNASFRLLKRILPGAYTCVLQATSDVPKKLQHKKKKTVGIRLSDHPFCRAFFALYQQPILSVSLNDETETAPLLSGEDIAARYTRQVDMVVDADYCAHAPSTVLDCTQTPPVVLRIGAGSIDFLDGVH